MWKNTNVPNHQPEMYNPPMISHVNPPHIPRKHRFLCCRLGVEAAHGEGNQGIRGVKPDKTWTLCGQWIKKPWNEHEEIGYFQSIIIVIPLQYSIFSKSSMISILYDLGQSSSGPFPSNNWDWMGFYRINTSDCGKPTANNQPQIAALWLGLLWYHMNPTPRRLKQPYGPTTWIDPRLLRWCVYQDKGDVSKLKTQYNVRTY